MKNNSFIPVVAILPALLLWLAPPSFADLDLEDDYIYCVVKPPAYRDNPNTQVFYSAVFLGDYLLTPKSDFLNYIYRTYNPVKGTTSVLCFFEASAAAANRNMELHMHKARQIYDEIITTNWAP